MGTKKKKTTDSVPFSADKLRYQIESHNFTQTSLAEELGFAANYLSKYVTGSRGEIPRRVTLLLETVGIHYEDYLPDPEPEPEHPMRIDPEDDPLPWDIENFEERLLSAPSTVVLSGESITELCKELHGVIYDAVYNATSKALYEVWK